MKAFLENVKEKSNFLWKKDEGIDGILVTVGLCIIALLLCIVMRENLTTFISTIVQELTTKATTILNSTSATGMIVL